MPDRDFDYIMRYLKAVRLVVALTGALALAAHLAIGG